MGLIAQPRWPVVLFDLDGTLVDTLGLIVASFRHAHREVLGLDLDEAVALSWIGRTLVDVYRQFPEPEALYQSYVRFNLANLEQLQRSYPGIVELMGDLKAAGVVTAIVTAKNRNAAERSVAAAGLGELIPLTTTLHETTRHKPNPEPLLHALSALGHDGPAVYVGDAVVDVLAARAAGIDQIAVTWGAGVESDLRRAEPSAGVIDTVAGLRALLLSQPASAAS